jgi:CHAT domain-containing protein
MLPADAEDSRTIAWRLYFGYRRGTGKEADLENSYARFREVTEVFAAQGDLFELAKSCYGLSILSGMLGKARESNEASRRGLEALRHWDATAESKDPVKLKWLAQTLRGLAENSSNTQERLDAAREGIQALTRLCDLPGKPNMDVERTLALFKRSYGTTYAHKDPRTEKDLERAEHYLGAALADFGRIGKNDQSKAKVHRELGRVLRARGRLKEALEAVDTAIAIYAGDDDASHWNHYQRAKILRDMGKWPEALAEILKAVKIIEEDREKFIKDDHRISFFAEKLAIYDFGIYLTDELKQPEVGFDLSQRCKARAFIESFRLKHAGPSSRELPVIQPQADLQGCLAADEALLEYHVGELALSIFALTKEGLSSARVARGREEIDGMVRTFRGFMRQPPTTTTAMLCAEQLADLSQDLLQPVQAALSGRRRLFIVPSGALAHLPFAALPAPDGKLFIAHWESCYLPSAAMLSGYSRRRRGSPERRLLVLANPTLDLDHAEAEAADISGTFDKSRVVVRERATKKALKSLDGTTHLHLACHGQYVPDDPAGSHLVLAAGPNDDGVLGVSEILGLPLANLDLAFLSCCKSADGRHRGGDEFEAVHRAFLHAGARSVVDTLWDLEDAATRELVASFYKRLAEGKSKVEALRSAQLDTLDRHPHPFYWSAFRLVGSAC